MVRFAMVGAASFCVMRIHHYLIFFNSFSSENECLAGGDACHGHRQHVTCRTPFGVMACVIEKK